jgi:hypothetical protein
MSKRRYAMRWSKCSESTRRRIEWIVARGWEPRALAPLRDERLRRGLKKAAPTAGDIARAGGDGA